MEHTVKNDIEKIKAIIEELKPQYTGLGGDIEFIDIHGQDVRIRPSGHCWR